VAAPDLDLDHVVYAKPFNWCIAGHGAHAFYNQQGALTHEFKIERTHIFIDHCLTLIWMHDFIYNAEIASKNFHFILICLVNNQNIC
jgi:hypothetical protein